MSNALRLLVLVGVQTPHAPLLHEADIGPAPRRYRDLTFAANSNTPAPARRARHLPTILAASGVDGVAGVDILADRRRNPVAAEPCQCMWCVLCMFSSQPGAKSRWFFPSTG